MVEEEAVWMLFVMMERTEWTYRHIYIFLSYAKMTPGTVLPIKVSLDLLVLSASNKKNKPVPKTIQENA